MSLCMYNIAVHIAFTGTSLWNRFLHLPVSYLIWLYTRKKLMPQTLRLTFSRNLQKVLHKKTRHDKKNMPLRFRN